MTQNDFEFLKSSLTDKAGALLKEIAENDALRKKVEEEARKKQEAKQEETKKTKKEKSE